MRKIMFALAVLVAVVGGVGYGLTVLSSPAHADYVKKDGG